MICTKLITQNYLDGVKLYSDPNEYGKYRMHAYRQAAQFLKRLLTPRVAAF